MIKFEAQKNPNSDTVNVSVDISTTGSDILEEYAAVFETMVKSLKKHDADLAFMLAVSLYIHEELNKIKNHESATEPDSYTSTLS